MVVDKAGNGVTAFITPHRPGPGVSGSDHDGQRARRMDHQPARVGISDQQDPIAGPQPAPAPDHGRKNQEALAADAEDPSGIGRHHDEAVMLAHLQSGTGCPAQAPQDLAVTETSGHAEGAQAVLGALRRPSCGSGGEVWVVPDVNRA
jgi:hypothetical protein